MSSDDASPDLSLTPRSLDVSGRVGITSWEIEAPSLRDCTVEVEVLDDAVYLSFEGRGGGAQKSGSIELNNQVSACSGRQSVGGSIHFDSDQAVLLAEAIREAANKLPNGSENNRANS